MRVPISVMLTIVRSSGRQWVLYRSVIERADDRRRAIERREQPPGGHRRDVVAVPGEVGLVGVSGAGGELGETARGARQRAE